MQVYVLSSCDTCRKALKWLRESDVSFESIDIRKDGIERGVIDAAIGELGWEKVLNRRSTSWRNLDAAARENLDDVKAAGLISANATLMKRPLFKIDGMYLVGFDEVVRARVMGRSG